MGFTSRTGRTRLAGAGAAVAVLLAACTAAEPISVTSGAPARPAESATQSAASPATTPQTPRPTPGPTAKQKVAAPAAATVQLTAPQFDSPGAAVPVVVTVRGFPSGARATFTLDAGDGVQTACAGPIWDSGAADRRSQTCYVWLPRAVGSVTPSATVKIETRRTMATVTGQASRAIQSRGEPSARLTLAQIRDIERCGNPTDDVWLTFDDAASAPQVDRLIDVLGTYNVQATFFMLGEWDRANPGLAQKLVSAGHVLGNHSSDHQAFSDLSREGVRAQIEQGLLSTDEPKLVRPPYAAGAFSSRVVNIADQLGYRVCRWTADTADWQPTSAEAMVERVLDGDALAPPLRPGGNVLMHAGNETTIAALPALIEAIRDAGLTLRPLR